jgi:hypothetical protein
VKPSIGRIVHYALTEKDVGEIHRRRVVNAGHGDGWPPGAQAHVGNPVIEGKVVPMIVCSVTPGSINGQAFLDGNDSLWVTSVKEGQGHGNWHWPERVD